MSVGQVVDFHLGLSVCFQFPFAVQVLGSHNNITAADSNLRSFHIADGKAAGLIDFFPTLRICFKQIPFFHLLQDPVTLLHIPKVGGYAGVAAAGAVVRDQFFQFLELGAQLGGVIHGSGNDVFFFHQRFRIMNAGICHFNIELRQIRINRRKGPFFPGRQKDARNINLHTILYTALQ